MFSRILSWFFTKGFSSLGEQLNIAYQNKLNAINDRQRIDAEIEIKKINSQISILLQEQRNCVTRWIRPAFAFPFILYNAKIIIWDKILEFGTTSPLSAELWNLQMIIFGAYFIARPIEKLRK